ncbi:murein L,D-transpeptidase [candidate division KSB1 bacterium]
MKTRIDGNRLSKMKFDYDLKFPDILCEFYIRHSFTPIWTKNDTVSGKALNLFGVLKNAGSEGLAPDEYHYRYIEDIFSTSLALENNPERIRYLADLEILMSDAFLKFTQHLMQGKVDPSALAPDWEFPEKKFNASEVLETIFSGKDPIIYIDSISNKDPVYIKLKEALSVYTGIMNRGGWNMIGSSDHLQKGYVDVLVPELKKRLELSGDLPVNNSPPSGFFDDELERSVKRFQIRHGLTPDGIVSEKTKDVLNIPVEDRIAQIKLNLERLRWLGPFVKEKSITVNIADFSLTMFENGKDVLKMRVVVGDKFKQTPVFREDMSYIVLNPEWIIPKSIVIDELFRLYQEDNNYFTRNNINILSYVNNSTKEITPDSVEWEAYRESTVEYIFRQEPGLSNPLGDIKFIFPNKFSVYLHDTPEKVLFGEEERAFSHGCIRIEKPVELALSLLRDNKDWKREKLIDAIESGSRIRIDMSENIPVNIIYLTAWIDEKGIIQFRNDIYDRDGILADAFFR